MSARASQGLQPLQWIAAPSLLCMVATVLFAAPVRVFGLALPEPLFPMILAFAWPIIRPSMVAPFALLLTGLFLDLFWGDALGLWPVALLLAYGAALTVRSLIVGQGGRVLAGWYVAAVTTAFVAAYLFAMLDSRTAPSLIATLIQYAFTIALFPFSRRLIERFEDADIRFR